VAALALTFDILAKDNASKAFNNVGDAAEKTGRKGEMLKKGLAVGAAAVAAAGAAAAVAGVKLFNHASALEAMGNKAKTVFGDQIGVVDKWAKANAGAMGLSSREAVGLAASFGDLLIPMGFTREAAAKMSTDVVGLSGALSQWSGGQTSAADAADILAKAMLGETDGLKSLGIAISAADIDAQLLKNGTNNLTGAQLAQAKATATQELIFAKSTDAQAAFKEGGNKLLSAQNSLRAKMKEVYDEAAVRLIPVFTAVATFVVDKMVPAFELLWQQHGPAVKEALRAIGDFITDRALPAFANIWSFIKDNVLPLLGDLAGYIADKVVPIVKDLAGEILGGLQDAFNNVRDKINENKPELQALFDAWQKVWKFIIENVIPLLGPVLKVAFEALGNTIGIAISIIGGIIGAFNAIKEPARLAIKFVVDAFLGFVETLVTGAAKAFGWVPGIGPKLEAAAKEIKNFRDAANNALNGIKDKTVTVKVEMKALYDEKAIARELRSQVGDGPGNIGGNAMRRVQSALTRGTYITSTYRTPEQNARAGGSPRSYHLDRSNPAVDIGGSVGALNALAPKLKAMGGWREFLWQTKGHYDHIHVAHDGGVVSPSWPTVPGLRTDERPAILQVGETVVPKGGDGAGTAEIVAAIAQLESRVSRLVRDHQVASRSGAI
jgi:hypothetical protein